MWKECHSHYHAHMKYLKVVENSFSGHHLIANFQGTCGKAHKYQKIYTCLLLPDDRIKICYLILMLHCLFFFFLVTFS